MRLLGKLSSESADSREIELKHLNESKTTIFKQSRQEDIFPDILQNSQVKPVGRGV